MSAKQLIIMSLIATAGIIAADLLMAGASKAYTALKGS